MKKSIPYDEIEPGIIKLVRSINAFAGLTTTESCEGHPDRANDNDWCVTFDVSHDEAGWFGLEFLTWVVGDYGRGRGKGKVSIRPHSAPPYINGPGNTLYFYLFGSDGKDRDLLADFLDEMKEECYIPPQRPLWKRILSKE